MRRFILCLSLFITLRTQAQQINPVPDYVFSNRMSVGRNAVTDTAAYFSIGPRYGAIRGFMPPMVTDTALVTGIKRNGLLIFSVQKNKFLYWDSVRVQWSDMAGGSGQYITGAGLLGYVPQFTSTTTIDTSALYTLGNRLGVGTNTFAYTQTNTANVELNGTAGGILGFKRNDSARGYLWHTGSDMELANTTAGSITFNTNSATRGSISSAGVWRLHNLAGTGDRVVVASSNGTLSATTSVTGLVDTLTISTRAWRQKGDDSLGAIIATKGSGTVTSVATGYGLSGGTITTTGTLLVDTLNIATRAWRQKGIDSVAGLSRIGGSGTTNYVAKFTAGSTIENSQIFADANGVGIGITDPASYLTGGRQLVIANTSGAAGTTIRTSNTGDGSIFFSDGTTGDETYRGYVQYIHASDALRFGTSATERMRIFANGRVGINTTTDAGYQLDVNGTLRSVNGANFATTSGNVGIGTASPGRRLHVQTPDGTASQLQIGQTNQRDYYIGIPASQTYFDFFDASAGASRMRINSDGEILVNPGSDAGDYKLQVAGNIYNTGSAVLAATSGNVGIGTASPGAGLEIQRAGATDHLTFSRNTSAGNANVKIGGNVLALVFENNSSSELMRLGIGGELLIGTSSDAGDYKLQVSGNIYNTGSAVLNSVTIANNTPYITGSNISTASSLAIGSTAGFLSLNAANNIIQFNTNSAERGRINSAGEWIIDASGTDAGDYKLQVSGNIYNTGSAVLAATSGNVGIGTASPSRKLSINVSPSSTNDDGLSISNGTDFFILTKAGSSYSTYGVSPDASIVYHNNGKNISFVNDGSGGGVTFHNSTLNEYARFNSSGELLLRTTGDSGAYSLQINGNQFLSSASDNAFITLRTISTKSPYVEYKRGTAQTWWVGAGINGDNNFSWYDLSNNSFRMTLTNANELLVNTTADAGAYNLQVAGPTIIKTAASNTPFHVENTAAALTYATFVNTGGRALIGSASDDIVFATSISANERMRLSASGELLLNTTSDQGDYKLQINGSSYTTGSVVRGVMNVNGTGAQISIDSTTNLTPLYFVSHKLTGSNASSTIYGNAEWNTTGNVNLIDFNITNTASGATSNFMRISDGTNIFRVTKEAEIVTAAPTGGSVRKWKLGEAATVSPTSPNRTIRVEIDGTVYYIHAKTTND